MNPIEGTEIIFLENGKWYNKNSKGDVILCHTADYYKRYSLSKSLVVVKGEDDAYITSLNGDAFTVVVDKDKIGRPNLESYEFTKEWMSLTDFLKLRKMTSAFCIMAKGFHIPER